MRHHRHAFTLVELLVVIGIISLLISILLPSLARARQSANSLVCLSNLRTMGQALIMYADQNKGMLPFGYWGGDPTTHEGSADWAALITGTMASGENTYAALGQSGRNKIFRDADTITGGELHYSAHPRLMPVISGVLDNTTGKPFTGYKLFHLQRSSEVAMLMDGAQILNNSLNADAVCYKIDHGRIEYGSFLIYEGYTGNSNPIEPGYNYDPPSFSGSSTVPSSNIRWRHLGDQVANFLFADGHAESRRLAKAGMATGIVSCDLLRGNINVNK